MAAPAVAFTMPKRPLTWLITGCSSGMGLALARQAQAGGHTVIASSRNPSRTPELVKEVESKGGKWVTLDLIDLDAGKVIRDLEASGVHIDVLVNSAGASIHSIVEAAAEEDVRSQMEVNYFGPARLVRAAVPYMRQRRFGVVANISSASSFWARDSMGIYGAAKAATDALMRTLASEVEPFNIRALSVNPGTFNTNMENVMQIRENLPDDYKGSSAEMLNDYLLNKKFKPDGDHIKAMKAMYEVIVCEGVGEGHENDQFLPLGRDLLARLKVLQDFYAKGVESFGQVAANVFQDKK